MIAENVPIAHSPTVERSASKLGVPSPVTGSHPRIIYRKDSSLSKVNRQLTFASRESVRIATWVAS